MELVDSEEVFFNRSELSQPFNFIHFGTTDASSIDLVNILMGSLCHTTIVDSVFILTCILGWPLSSVWLKHILLLFNL